MSLTPDESYIMREAKKIKAIRYLGEKCNNCGENNYIFLEFHHVDMNDKLSDISSIYTKSWSYIKNEIEKCILLCCKCHKKIHYNFERYKKYKSVIEKKIIDIDTITPRNRVVSDKEREKIIKLFKKCKNINKLTRDINIGEGVVRRVLYEEGFWGPERMKRLENILLINKEKIIKLYNINFTTRDIISKLKLNIVPFTLNSYISKMIENKEIIKRERIAYNQIASDEDIIKLYNNNISKNEMSKSLGIKVITLRKRLKRLSDKNKIILRKENSRFIK